ncbi:type II toxin-antitoxin system HicA family toxin [uncultured Desulfuromusa sp.]|uniref:type II toxin-antitoxin system HicA family toxin n=1 Tax=uncultured Desulfuromusa sp. TaxID=219183 RepID=UPI0037494445
MSKHKKALQRLFSKPKDFRWNELCSLLVHLGFKQLDGKGSRVKFFHEEKNEIIIIHNPHPENTIAICYIRQIIEKLEKMGVSA